jgi:hypothetical protein
MGDFEKLVPLAIKPHIVRLEFEGKMREVLVWAGSHHSSCDERAIAEAKKEGAILHSPIARG